MGIFDKVFGSRRKDKARGEGAVPTAPMKSCGIVARSCSTAAPEPEAREPAPKDGKQA